MSKYKMVIVTKSVVTLNNELNDLMDSKDQEKCSEYIGELEVLAESAHDDLLDDTGSKNYTTSTVIVYPIPNT